LAGKSIIEALSLTERLDISSVVVCPEAETEMKKFLAVDQLKKHPKTPTYFTYAIPLKDCFQKLFTLNQWALHDKYVNSDLSQLVAQAFWKHGKDMDSAVLQKYQNTEMLLRYIVALRREWKTN
jgi:hypothetical protein